MSQQQRQGTGGAQQSGQMQSSNNPEASGQMHGTGQYQYVRADQRGGLRFHTRNYLNVDVRQATCVRLNQLLADTTALRMAARDAHWNVKGMNFYALHELFEDIAEALAAQEDAIAERITALGGQAKGSLDRAATRARITDLPSQTITCRGFLQELAGRMAAHDANLYDAIRATEEYGDLDTTDLLNEVSREVSHHLWFLEAHLQGPAEAQVPAGGQAQQYRENN